MTQTIENLGQRTATGMLWIAGQTVVSRATSFITQLLLAWLLAREDFGSIALVTTITGFARQISTPGVDDVLLQKQKRLPRWVNAAFWLALACSLGGALLMVLLGAVTGMVARQYGNAAYGDPKLLRMILIVALGVPLQPLGLIPMVILRAELRFARVAAVNLGELLALQTLTVLFAALGFGAYSFVLPLPLVDAARGLTLFLMVRPAVRARLAIHRWPSLLGSTGWVFGSRILILLTGSGGYILLGAIVADETVVGQYFFAFMLATQVLRMLADNAGAVLMPALNTLQDGLPRMRRAVELAGRSLAALVIPVACLQIILAPALMRLLFASKWEPSIPLVQWLSVGPLLLAASWPMGSMIFAQGRFQAQFWLWVVGAVSFFALVTPATWLWQAEGASVAVSLWQWFSAAVAALFAYQSLSGLVVLFRSVARPLLVAATATAVAALAIWPLPHTIAGDLASTALGGCVFTPLYALGIWLLDAPTFQSLSKYFRAAVWPLVRRFSARPAPD